MDVEKRFCWKYVVKRLPVLVFENPAIQDHGYAWIFSQMVRKTEIPEIYFFFWHNRNFNSLGNGASILGFNGITSEVGDFGFNSAADAPPSTSDIVTLN